MGYEAWVKLVTSNQQLLTHQSTQGEKFAIPL